MPELTEGEDSEKLAAIKNCIAQLDAGEGIPIEELRKASIALPNSEPSTGERRKNLADFLMEPPFAGVELNLDRPKQYMRPVEL